MLLAVLTYKMYAFVFPPASAPFISIHAIFSAAFDGRTKMKSNKGVGDEREEREKEKWFGWNLCNCFFSHFILITSCYKYSGPFITFKLNGSPGLLTNWIKLQYDHTQNSWYSLKKKRKIKMKMKRWGVNTGRESSLLLCSYCFFLLLEQCL